MTHQELMDRAYNRYTDEKSYDDMLSESSPLEQLAVLAGNYNYQVGNGGHSQWVFNGYGVKIKELCSKLERVSVKVPLATRVAENLRKLEKFIETTAENRGCMSDYFTFDQDDEDEYNEFETVADKLDDAYYEISDEFMKQLDVFFQAGDDSLLL